MSATHRATWERSSRMCHIRNLGDALATLVREHYDLPLNINEPG